MCVIATSGRQGPLAPPGRYSPLGFAVLFTAAAASPKMRNIAADPRVSVGVFAPLVGPASSRGAQIFGRARTLVGGAEDYAHYCSAFRWQPGHVKRSRSLDEPPADPLIV